VTVVEFTTLAMVQFVWMPLPNTCMPACNCPPKNAVAVLAMPLMVVELAVVATIVVERELTLLHVGKGGVTETFSNVADPQVSGNGSLGLTLYAPKMQSELRE
jgi:hypothetical protein